MNLSQLKFAQAVAASGSFTAAATDCCVTQPTLSNAIAQLEDELGERLFARTTRKVTLTPFGAHVLPHVADILDAQATLLRQAEAFLRPDRRLIRIGTSPLLSSKLLGLMIEPFRQAHPAIDVVLREMNMKDLYRMLAEGLLDFVFGVAKVQPGSWHTAPLYEEALLFIPRGKTWAPQADASSVPLIDITNETYVMVPDACGLSRATRALFRSHRRKLHAYSGEAMSYQVLEEWAELGIGAAILPRSKVGGGRQPAYPITGKDGREVRIGFEASWSRSGSNAPHLLEFAQHLRLAVPGIVAALETGAVGPATA
ncbi:MAG TPA: LysR family transcriptional regulator [Janthinobacterium sp.]|nr:LysR family transcriptional regulator [Janthinobacterium sp.]